LEEKADVKKRREKKSTGIRRKKKKGDGGMGSSSDKISNIRTSEEPEGAIFGRRVHER